MSKTAKELSIEEVYRLLDHLMAFPAEHTGVIRPLFIWGRPGLGKTEMVRDYAASRGLGFSYCAPAQFEEMGDLHGIPEVEDGQTIYRKPSWIPEDNGKPGILLLDDMNRADPRIIRGVMQLAQLHELMSWKLPANWLIVCTGNPDTSDFQTTILDDAVMTRFIHVRTRFDKLVWARWAMNNGIPEIGVNFVLTHPELVEKGKLTNARTLTSFFRLISGLTPWKQHTDLIETLGFGLLDQETIVSFFNFLNNSAAQIPEPETILYSKNTAELTAALKALLAHKDGVRLDLFSTAFNRLYLACEKPLQHPVNVENLVAMFQLPEIPNDFRTFMFVEFGRLKNPELQGLMKDRRIATAVLQGA